MKKVAWALMNTMHMQVHVRLRGPQYLAHCVACFEATADNFLI